MKVKHYLAFIIFFLAYNGTYSQSQDGRLAIEFIKYKEYNKAEPYLDTLVKQDIDKYFIPTFKVKVELYKYNEALKLAQFAQKKYPKSPTFYFYEGKAYNYLQDSIKAANAWVKANQKAKNNNIELNKLINEYKKLYKWEQIIDIYERTDKHLNYRRVYIEALLRMSEYQKAIDMIVGMVDESEKGFMKYIYALESYKGNSIFIRNFEKSVYSKLSNNPNSHKWNEICILTAMFIEDYDYALTLAKAFHKRVPEQISKVWNVSENSLNSKKYNIAQKGYKYIIDFEKNKDRKAYAYYYYIKSLYNELEKTLHTDSSIVSRLDEGYKYYFDSLNGLYYYDIMSMYSEYLFKYKKNIDSAISISDLIINNQRITGIEKSKAKLSKADYLLSNGDIWEASLLYGQVGKIEKDNPIGEDARFKNAKIFYFNGDYDLAEDLLSILKSSTTELIANDALNLSVFIQENRDNDSFELAMKEVSAAELLFYQNRVKEAYDKLNFVLSIYPFSKLVDDVLLIKAKNYSKRKFYTQAIDNYDRIINAHKESILVDRAMMEKAIILEDKLNKPQKAKEIYLKIMTNFHDSVFIIEARKRYRSIVGSDTNM